MSRLVSVEEARAAHAAEYRALADGEEPIARRFALVGHLGSTLASLDAVTVERDRLRAILACERGEEAPEGWEWSALLDQWVKSGDAYMRVQRYVYGHRYCIAGKWSDDHYTYALEAIEAADRAATQK